MQESKPKFLLSDANSLRRIKFTQFRRQVPSLILLALAIVLQNIFGSTDLGNLPLILAVAAVAWYLLIGFSHRFRQRIALPPPLALVSPIQGKVRFIRSNGDITMVNIRKILLDGVEIRCPHRNCLLEDGALILPSPAGKVAFRFNFKSLQWFADAEFATGAIIGMAYGTGSCTISFPGEPSLQITESSALDAGDTIIRIFDPEASEQPPVVEPALLLSEDSEDES